MQKTLIVILTAALFAAGFALPSASADHCTSNVYVFSSVRAPDNSVGTPAAAYNGVACVVTDDEDADARIINPGATAVRVRYIGPEACSGSVTVEGLGFSGESFPLAMGTFCNGPWMTIPGGPLASGTLTLTVRAGDSVETTVYRRA